MNLVEPLERINYYLEREFGRWPDGRAIWRVVFSEDMYEQRLMNTTDTGEELLTPEVRQVKKYQHIKERYVLERLVPVVGETDLVTPTSYEPAWTFQDRFDNYLPPRIDACKYIIEAIYAQQDKKGTHVKYKDETNTPEAREQLLKDTELELFGNETPVGDALAHGFGVTDFHQKTTFSEEKNS